jgi:hypothetical protein
MKTPSGKRTPKMLTSKNKRKLLNSSRQDELGQRKKQLLLQLGVNDQDSPPSLNGSENHKEPDTRKQEK